MLLFLTVTSLALQASVADTSPFRALPLPAANRVRGASGAPGPDYWQQRADYVIRATLDTAGSVLRGTERVHYENHSPDTLRFVWVQVEQNIFAKNSVTYALNQPPLHFAGGAVFDDVHGWNPLPYIGAGECYLEYGDFDVTLTLPAGFVVAATGTVQNPLAVWTPGQRARLARAMRSTERVQIITKDEAVASGAERRSGSTAWHFSARRVRDFAWAASPDFRWDASSWNGILIQTFYRPSATWWEEANAMAWFTIKHFSEAWGMYPWPHATTVESLVEGMEYPMLTFVPSIASREDQYWVLTHEFGHEWFPMMVGSDERRYPWMDEGFNTFIDYGSAEGYFKGTT